MVTIQPLHFEKVTAFKERIQLLNKINEIIAELDNYVSIEYLSDVLTDFYTKNQVDELIASIDLSDYYTKEEVNTINNLVNYYNITQLNATFEQINDRIISGEETLEDEIVGKQDLLTAGDNITITDNVISAIGGGFKLFENTDWSSLITNRKANKHLIMVFSDGAYAFIPKNMYARLVYIMTTKIGDDSIGSSIFTPPYKMAVVEDNAWANATFSVPSLFAYMFSSFDSNTGLLRIRNFIQGGTYTKLTNESYFAGNWVRLYVSD